MNNNEIKEAEVVGEEIIKSDSSLQEVNQSRLPILNTQGIDKFYEEVRDIVENNLEDGHHYGPPYEGCKRKMLLKPGVDFFCTVASLIDHYDDPKITNHDDGHKTYEYICRLQRLIGGDFISKGEAVASTNENFYKCEPSKIPDKIPAVIKKAKLRAKREAVEAFFNPSRFFKNNNPGKKQQPQKKNRVEWPNWKPTPEDLLNPDWFIKQIQDGQSKEIIATFTEEFKSDIGRFGQPDTHRIQLAINERFEELG